MDLPLSGLWGHTNIGRCLALDGSGNTFVAGYTKPQYGASDCLTVKFAPDGSLTRAMTYSYTNDWDQANAIKIDSSGNIYITGQSANKVDYSYDYLTLKYSNDGDLLWASRYNGSGAYFDQAFALDLDSASNVYVTGVSYGSSADCVTIKYFPDGTQAWLARYSSPSNRTAMGEGIVTLPSGGVAVCGISDNASSVWDRFIIQYGADGSLVWSQAFSNVFDTNGWFVGVGTDATGAVYMASTTYDPTNKADFLLIKYDSSGSQPWSNRYNLLNLNNVDNAKAVKTDSAGNVYVTGSSQASDTETDFVTMKYAPSGLPMWNARYAVVGQSNDVTGLALDEFGNSFVTGSSGPNCATLMYDANGNEIWRAYYTNAAGVSAVPKGIAVDRYGNVTVAGNYFTTTNAGIFVVRYDQQGNTLWRAQDSTGTMDALIVDSQANSFVCGGFATNAFFLTLKFDANGSNTWRSFETDYKARASALALDGLGNLYNAGVWSSAPYGPSIMVIKYGPTGTRLWRTLTRMVDSTTPTVRGAATDSAGNLCVCGF